MLLLETATSLATHVSPKKHQEQLLLDQKDELLSAQTQLRRQMGALLEDEDLVSDLVLDTNHQR